MRLKKPNSFQNARPLIPGVRFLPNLKQQRTGVDDDSEVRWGQVGMEGREEEGIVGITLPTVNVQRGVLSSE